MKYFVAAIFDSASAAFARPMFLQAPGQAVRAFSDEVNRGADDNVMFHHPDHFSLFELGTFDDAQARFELLPAPRQLALGTAVSLRLVRAKE